MINLEIPFAFQIFIFLFLLLNLLLYISNIFVMHLFLCSVWTPESVTWTAFNSWLNLKFSLLPKQTSAQHATKHKAEYSLSV